MDGKPNMALPRERGTSLYLRGRLVHYCSQQRGAPGVPLDTYTTADIRHELPTPAVRAFCTVGCVHWVSMMDFWRSPRRDAGSLQTGPGRHA